MTTRKSHAPKPARTLALLVALSASLSATAAFAEDGVTLSGVKYDYDAQWKPMAAYGQGIYGDETVQVTLRNVAGGVAICRGYEDLRVEVVDAKR